MEHNSPSPLVGVQNELPARGTPTFLRICLKCEGAIPQARVRAMPSARFCVPCQESLGDVAPIRRFDDSGVDGEMHESYFVSSADLEREMMRRREAEVDEIPSDHILERPNIHGVSLSVAVARRERELFRENSLNHRRN